MADTPITNLIDYYADVDRAIAKYPLDLRASEQLMQQNKDRFAMQVRVAKSTGLPLKSEVDMSLAGGRRSRLHASLRSTGLLDRCRLEAEAKKAFRRVNRWRGSR